MSQIILPRLINNAFVKAHHEWIFVHGHDVQKKGAFGQATIYGNSNCYPIPTMYKFCASGARYFTDSDSSVEDIISYALHRIPSDSRPIIILRKLGEGCSRMSELAPNYFREMKEVLGGMQYHNIKWDYSLTYGLQY